MKYLCLVYADEQALAVVDDAECVACNESLEQNGQRIAAEALDPVRTALTVRVRDGHVSVTDGPFAETKEQVAGFFLIDARDLDEAIDVAAKMPQSRIGSIEVRPIQDLTPHRRALQ